MLLEEAGFTEIVIEPRGTDITVACYKILCVGYRWLFGKKTLKKILSVACAPLLVVALLVGQISVWRGIGETDDCLGYVVYARNI